MDLVHWTQLPDALPNLPPWAQAGRTWAPDAALAGDGSHYNLYFTASAIDSGRQAIGVATSSNPAGPFTTIATAPLVAQTSQGGAIDPSVFTASDGSQYLLWKNDGNALGTTTFIYIQRLSADGLSLVGSPRALIANDQAWESRVVEGPVLWQHGSKYYLYYSANAFDTSAYAIGYAVSSTLMGGYVKPAQPLVKTENGVVGPGGPEIVVGPDGNPWLLYHSWENNIAYRSLSIDWLSWNGDLPVVRGPSRSPQPLPVHPTVLGRFTLNGSAGVLNGALETDKQALLPGHAATGQNLTGYVHGLTGIAIDVSSLPADAALSAADFGLKVGTSADPSLWTAAPTPTAITLHRGAGVNGSDRVTLTWTNDAIVNEWLAVTLNADGNTALALPDVFYFGNLVGDTGNDAGSAAIVSALDLAAVRMATGLPVTPTTVADLNKDGVVDGADAAIAHANLTHSLVLLTVGGDLAGFSGALERDQASTRCSVRRLSLVSRTPRCRRPE
jgi:hypothetical protein